MKRLAIIIGIVLWPMLPVQAQDVSLYDEIKKATRLQYVRNGIEDSVANYIKDLIPMEPQLSASTIDMALENNEEFCSTFELDIGATCNNAMNKIRLIAEREQRIRSVGRELQLIAAGYEIPINDHPSRMLAFGSKFPSIIRIWQSSQDYLFSPITERRIRTLVFPDIPAVNDGFDNLMADLQTLNAIDQNKPELLTAAVWRYRYGLQAVFRDSGALPCTPEMANGNGTEMQFQDARWCDIEDELQGIFNATVTHYAAVGDGALDPAPQYGEIFIFPSKFFRDLGIIVWMRMGFDQNINDIGLEWELPLEPVLPSLDCTQTLDSTDECHPDKDVILGGTYPDEPPFEPAEMTNLCAHAFNALGYLCRPIERDVCVYELDKEVFDPFVDPNGPTSPDPLPDPPSEAKSSSIKLFDCIPQNIDDDTYSKTTESGPNACQLGGWISDKPNFGEGYDCEDTPNVDEGINRPYKCAQCAVDVYCNSNAPTSDADGNPVELGCGGSFAITRPKDDNNVIKICLPDSLSDGTVSLPISHLLTHELIHAQQLCNLPASDTQPPTSLEACCAIEIPAYHVQCSLYAEDGAFEGTDITVELCTGVLANQSCEHLGGPPPDGSPDGMPGEYCSKIDNPERLDELKDMIFDAVKKAAQDGVGNFPAQATDCTQAIEDMYSGVDTRSQLFINSIQQVCTPECQTRYTNTIGNNACYIAQCIEQSIEQERIYPGRWSQVASEQIFHHDSGGYPSRFIGELLRIPTLSATKIPQYRPEEFARELDLAICQRNALPYLPLAVQCEFDPQREDAQQYSSIITQGMSYVNVAEAEEQAVLYLEELAQTLGARMGMRLFEEYFDTASKSFHELILSTNLMLEDISQIRFPLNMCFRVEP